jgi:Rieske Fe-S protein
MKNRRNILRFGVLSFFSFVIAACAKAVSGSSQEPTTSQTNEEAQPVESVEPTQPTETTEQASSSVVIAQVSALVAGEGSNFTANDGTDAILFKTKDEKVYALSRICTHEGCSVEFDLAQNKLICPCHGATYEAPGGNVISGPTQRNLKKINVKIDGDNVLEVV